MSWRIRFEVNEDFEPWVAAKAQDVIDRSTDTVARTVVDLMATVAPAGRLYRRGRGFVPDVGGRAAGWHRASAPGQPPAPDTETLMNAVAWTGEDTGFARRTYLGVDNAEAAKYAIPLEVGTATIAPRPAWLRALYQSEGQLGSFE